jgi:hypothetical protein
MKPASIFLCLVLLISASCDKSEAAGKLVEIYQFKIPRNAGPCKIDSSRAELTDVPLISNSAIRSYNKKDHEFLISNEAGEKINRLMDNEALAITVDKELIYYFVNKPMYSSSICGSHISMNHSFLNKISMYIVNINPAVPVPDQRNDSRLMNALAAQGKLK